MDTLIQNCTVYDGTGAPAYLGSVGFDSGKICVFRAGEAPAVHSVIDAGGLALVIILIVAISAGRRKKNKK